MVGVRLLFRLMIFGFVLWVGAEVHAEVSGCGSVRHEDRTQALMALKDEWSNQEFKGKATLCSLAHVYYKLGARAEGGDLKKKYWSECMSWAKKASLEDEGFAWAHFLHALCLGKKGEVDGMWASFGIIKPFEAGMLKALSLDPTLDEGGPDRALGRLYYELPFILGGDLDKAIAHLRQAVVSGPGFWENHWFLAEALNDHEDHSQAKEALSSMLSLTENKNDETLNPRIYRLRLEAKKMLEEISVIDRDEEG